MSTPPGPRRHGSADATDQYAPQPRQQPRPQQPQPAPAVGDSRVVHILRIVAYVLTSLASLVFLLLVIYAYVKIGQLQQALSSNPLFGGGSSYSGPAVPGSLSGDPGGPTLPSQQELCQTNPTAPECAAN